MLGEQIGTERGKVTNYRISRSDSGPNVEVAFQAAGKILGVDHATLATYVSSMRPDGTVYGEGQGVVRGAGGQMASWVGQGVGTLGRGQAISYRGAIYYQSQSPEWKRLNGVAAVFDHVGGPGIADSWRMLAKGGTLVSYGTASTRDVPGNPRLPVLALLARLTAWNLVPNGRRATRSHT